MKPIFLFFLILFSCNEKSKETETIIEQIKLEKGDLKLPNYELLTDLNIKLGQPKPGEWLYNNHEKEQSYSDYIKSNPVSPFKDINIIYIQPIGTFTPWEQKIINWNTEYIELFLI